MIETIAHILYLCVTEESADVNKHQAARYGQHVEKQSWSELLGRFRYDKARQPTRVVMPAIEFA